MARKERIHYEGALYHVICRGNNREYIFEKNYEKEKYVELLIHYKKRYQFKIYAYCIMGNHAHILIEVGKVPLSKIMQGIQQVYTYYYNKQNNRSGHVFEQRYKAILCNKDYYLLSLIRYIHQNPVRAGLKGGLSYPYSSHKNYILDNPNNLVDRQFPLSVFGKSLKHQLEGYNEFVGVKENVIQDLKDDELAEEIEAYWAEEQRIDKFLFVDILEAVCGYYDIKTEEISLKVRTNRLVKARKIIIILAKSYCDLSNKELAEGLNMSQPAISNIIADIAAKEDYEEDIMDISNLNLNISK